MPKALNAENVQVNLQFTADTAQAKRELQQLQNTLKSIVKDPAEGFSLDKKMAEASRYAAELSVHLKKATTQNGTLDFSRLNESIKKSGMSLSQYGDKLLSLGPQGRQAFSQLATAVSQSEIPIRRVNGALAQMGTVLKNTIRWQLSSTAIHAFSGAIQTAYNYAKDLNESLNNIRIVTGYNTDQMDKFAVTANKAAKALSTSTLDYTNAALIYYQQGLSDKEVEARTNVTAKMANVTRQSAEEVSNQLTAIWNNYAQGAENLEYYADVITALGAATASSSAEIATGLEKFASVGETVGLSYEYATAALATVTATTRQSAEVVGNAFKTLFSRIQGLKLGETLEDGTDLNKYSSALMAVGVNIKDASGNLKDMDVILDETALKWRTLGKEQQTALAQTVGGARQYTQFMALMNNWDFMEKNLQTARGSSGSLQKQQDIYAESWEAAAKRVKAAWEDVYSSLINDDFFIDLLGFIEKAVKGFKNLIGAMGGIPGILTTIGSIAMMVFGKQMAEGLTNMTYSIRSLTATGRQKMVNERQDQLNQMGTLAAQHMTGNGVADQAWITNLQQRIQLQDQLTQHVNKLSETERFVAQSLQDQVIERQKLVDIAAHEVEKAQNELSLIKEQAFEEAKAQNPKIQQSIFNQAWDGLKNQNQVNAGLLKGDLFSYITKQSSITPETINKIKDDANELLKSYANQIKASPEGKNIQKNLETLMNLNFKDGAPTKAGQTAVKNLVGMVRTALVNMKTTVAAQSEDALAGMGVSVDRVKTGVDNLVVSEEKLISVQKSAQTAIEGVTNFIDIASQKTMTWQEQLVSFGQVAMSAGMLFNQLSGLISTWDNDDLTFGEKLFSSLTSIGMILPMILSGYKTLEASISSIVAKHQLSNVLQTTGLGLEQAQLGIAGLRKLSTKEELTDQEKINAAKLLGVSADQAGNALAIIRKMLTNKQLTDEEFRLGVQMGILAGTTAENAQLTIQLGLQKAIKAVVMSNPIVAIIGAAIVALMAFAAILKKIKQEEKERLEQQQNADKETLGKTKERISEMQQESEELHKLVSAMQEVNDAYKRGEATKDDLFEATKNLVDQYQIEGAELLLLQGRYDELTAAANRYEAAENRKRISELEGKQTEGFGTAKVSPIQMSRAYFKEWQGMLSPEEQALISDLSTDARTQISFDKINNAEDVIAQYNLLKNLQEYLLENKQNTSAVDAQIKALQEYYDTAIAIQDELTTRYDKKTGYDTFFGADGVANYEADINNVKQAVDDLTAAYGGNKEKAEEYLKSIGGWDDLLITQKALEQKAKSSGIDYDTLLNIYNSLSDSEKQVLFKLNITYGSDAAEIIEAIKTGTVEVEMQVHQTNANALTEAQGHFKKGMTRKETSEWAKKYGVDFGDENSAMGIGLDDFMSKTDSQKENYIAQRIVDQQEQAYKKAQEILEKNKNLDLTEKQTLQAKKTGLESTLAHLIGVDPETAAIIEAELKTVTDKLNNIYDTEGARDIVDEEKIRNIERFSSALEKAKDIKLGDSISNDEMIDFTKGIGEGLKDYFVQNDDGTWTLVVDKIEFKEGLKNAVKEHGELSSEQQRAVAEQATTYNELLTDQSSFGISQDIVADNVQKLALKYEDCTDALNKYNKALRSGDSEKARKAYIDLIKSLKIEEFKNSAKTIKELSEAFNKLSAEAKKASKSSTYTKIKTELKNIFGEGLDIDDSFIEAHWSSIQKLTNGDQKIVEQGVNEIIDAYGKAQLIIDNIVAGNAEAFEWTIKVDDGEAIQVADEFTSLLEQFPDEVKTHIDLQSGTIDVAGLLQSIWSIKDGAAIASSFLKTLASSNAEFTAEGLAELEGLLSTLENAAANGDPAVYGAALTKFLSALSNVKIQAEGNADTRVSPYLGSVGGGGGSSKKQQAHKEKEEERYHYEKETLSDLEKQLERLKKAKDRVYGPNRVKAIEKEIKTLEREIEAQKALIAEIKRYEKIDLDRLLNGKENAFQIKDKDGNYVYKNLKGLAELVKEFPQYANRLTPVFDELGNIVNWDEIKDALWEILHNCEVAYNTVGDIHEGDEQFLEEATKQYEELLKVLQQLEDTRNELRDAEDTLQDMEWEKQDLAEEKIAEAIKWRIQMEKNEIAMIDSMIRTLDWNIYKSIEVAGLMEDKFKKLLENSGHLRDDYQEWVDAFNNGEISAEAFREHMQEIFDEAGQSIEELMSHWEEMRDYYSQVLNEMDARLKLETRIFGNLVDELEYYSELMDLSGHEQDYDKKLEILRAEQDVLKDRLAVDKETQDLYQSEYDKLKAEYDAALAAGDTDKAEFLYPSVQAAADKLDEINQQVRDDIKQIAELAQKEFSTTLDKVYSEAEKKLTGGLGFDYLSQTMDLASKRADEYLTKTNQIYETSQLLRNINRDMDKTDSVAAKTKLNNFSKEIQALQEKGELSHYELEDAKARYEVLKAQIALEEAQNAKSTVRLQRDNEGNYGYVYTADKDAIAEAEDNLAKAQNDRYNLALETQQEYLRKFYDTEREAQEALRKLDEDYAAGRIESEEEYRRRRQEIIEYYSDLLETYEGIHTQAIGVMHETAAEHMNDSWTAAFGDENGNGLIGKTQQWRDVTIESGAEVDDALTQLKQTMEEVIEPEYDNLSEKIKHAREESKGLREELLNNFLPKMREIVSGISDMTIAWSDYAAQLRDALQALLELQAAANQQIQSASGEGDDDFDMSIDYSARAAEAQKRYQEALAAGNEKAAEEAKAEMEQAMRDREEKKRRLGSSDTSVANSRIQAVLDAANDSSNPKHDDAVAVLNAVNGNTAFFTDDFLKQYGFDTGGYTGKWNDGTSPTVGKLALLHEKELVLNQDDTKHMLATVQVVRKLSDIIDLQALDDRIGRRTGGDLTPESLGTTFEQTVNIYADFPNAVEHEEIRIAFDDLINRASQYAFRYEMAQPNY